MQRQKRKKNQGFTLIELIVVIAILGILAAIIMAQFGGFTESAKQRADEANANVLNHAAAMWATDPVNNLNTVTVDKLDTAKLIVKADIKDPWNEGGVYAPDESGVFSPLGTPTSRTVAP